MPPRSPIPPSLLLLTLATGAVDAIGFLALGGVFSSVMTANLGLLGLAAGSGEPTLARHALVAIGGFVAGVLLGSRLATSGTGGPWTGVRGALMAELVILCGILAAWAALDGEPDDGARLALLAAAAAAMGCQSGTIRVAGPAGVSTTYMTGSLTGVIGELAATGRLRAGNTLVIAMLPVGAVLGGLAVAHARTAAPAVPAALVAAALAAAGGESQYRGPRPATP